ncbi:hypothetical protein [Streptomyces sp. NRRL WC-3618]|uniref:hypothetical protein n=1 Tax=Streptomyces sp. NRRL WC-3618 TaxID=1519490 RepID=UPI00131A9132|nr:hypothetical protein [Streptomyces sp. NRRL WC-3618]
MEENSPSSTNHTQGGTKIWVVVAGISLALAASLTLANALGAKPGRAATLIGVLVGLTGFLGSVTQLLRDKLTEVPRWQRATYAVVIGCVFAGGVVVLLRFQAPPPPLYRLTGPQDVAVVGFKNRGSGQEQQLLDDVSSTFAQALSKALPQGTVVHDYATQYELPLTELLHGDHRRLDSRTRKFVGQSNAAILVGGIVTPGSGGQINVHPAVYVRADQVPDAPELAGWYTSAPVPADQSLGLAHSRGALVAELVRQASGLAQFTSALDAWHSGRTTEAVAGFARLLSGKGTSDLDSGTGFVTSDLVHLFRGHALEQTTVNGQAASRSVLEAAGADYRAIPADSPIRRRAQLSLASNVYLRAETATECAPGALRDSDIAGVTSTLRRLMSDANFTTLGRLKAAVNLAQVEYCRINAGLTSDDGTIDALVRRVRAAGPGVGVRELKALAASIAAQREADRGQLEAAISGIRQALALESHFVLRAQWLGWLAAWAFAQCHLVTGDQAARDSLDQLRNAFRTGAASRQDYEAGRKYLDQQRNQAHTQCGSGSPR